MTDERKPNRSKRTSDEEHTHPTETHKDLLQYDPEVARDLLDVEDAVEAANDLQRPNRVDPRHTDPTITPGQENVPQGFTSGRGMGGSAKRRKRQ